MQKGTLFKTRSRAEENALDYIWATKNGRSSLTLFYCVEFSHTRQVPFTFSQYSISVPN